MHSNGHPGAEMQYLKTFAFSIGRRYQDWFRWPIWYHPNKTRETLSYEGWAYCARTDDKQVFLAYFEKGCPPSQIRGARLNSIYRAQWFNPRKVRGMNVGTGKLASNKIGILTLPDFPGDSIWASG